MMSNHEFKDDSNCSKCNCYGPNEEALPCVEEGPVPHVLGSDEFDNCPPATEAELEILRQEPIVPYMLEGATVQGTINESGDWEPMVSIPISEYEELLEFKFMYEGLSK